MMTEPSTRLWCRLLGHRLTLDEGSRLEVDYGESVGTETYRVWACTRSGCDYLAPAEEITVRTVGADGQSAPHPDHDRTIESESGTYR